MIHCEVDIIPPILFIVCLKTGARQIDVALWVPEPQEYTTREKYNIVHQKVQLFLNN